jgi:hypothetical protein
MTVLVPPPDCPDWCSDQPHGWESETDVDPTSDGMLVKRCTRRYPGGGDIHLEMRRFASYEPTEDAQPEMLPPRIHLNGEDLCLCEAGELARNLANLVRLGKAGLAGRQANDWPRDD